MKKRKFFIYQEDLIKFSFDEELLSISQIVETINSTFCHSDMKKIRAEEITNLLFEQGFLFVDEDGKMRPTKKGVFLGISPIEDEEGNYYINYYNKRAQNYILNHLPFLWC